MAITLRQLKGSPLSWAELDQNFLELQAAALSGPLTNPKLVFSSAVNWTCPLDLNTNYIYPTGIMIPGGLLGPTGSLRTRIALAATNNANAKMAQVFISQSPSPGGVVMHQWSAASVSSIAYEGVIWNRGSLGSQLAMYRTWGIGTSIEQASTVDTTQPFYLHVSAQKSTVAGDSLIVRHIQIFSEYSA